MEYNVTPYKYPRYLKWNTEAHHDANNKMRQKFNSIQTKCSRSKKIYGLQP